MRNQTEELLLRIVENSAKIKKLLNELKELTNTRPVDRGRCVQILSELEAPCWVFVISFVNYLGKKKELSELAYELAKKLNSLFDYCLSRIDALRKECSRDASFNDDTISHLILEKYGEITRFLSSIEQVLGIPSGLQYLALLIEEYGYDSNWIVAVAYLAAMEVAVNRKLGELGINVGSGEFKDRVNALLRELERRGVQLGELEKLLPQAFWRLRNEVIHGGYTPSDEELQIIVTAVSNLLEKIGALRSP